jgi:hypothetical protein
LTKKILNALDIERSLYDKGKYFFSMSIIVLKSPLVWGTLYQNTPDCRQDDFAKLQER